MAIEKLDEFKKTLLAYAQLIRIKNCGIAALSIFITAAMVLGEFGISVKILYAAVAVAVITAAGNIFNDYYDYVIDKINRPNRPIPSGKVRRSDAMMLSIILFLLGIAMAYNINKICFALAVLNSLILMAYARYSKKMFLVSNFVVSYLIASVFIFGSLAAAGDISRAKPVFVLAACAFLMTFSREITKDIEDVKGDKESGARTLPICKGEETAKTTAIVFSVFAVLLGFIPYIFEIIHNPLYYLILILAADGIFIYSLMKPAKESQKLMVYGMLMALVAFFVGSIRI